MAEQAPEAEIPTLVPVSKPVSLIPVGIKEAGLDSPSFRSTATHLGEQLDIAERWLEGLVRSAGKLAAEATALEPLLASFANHCRGSASLAEAVIDHDYTVGSLKSLADGAVQDCWMRTMASIRNTQTTVVEPVRTFIFNELKPFKEARRSLEASQRTYDSLILRFAGQSKTKEPSSLREDAFQVHEARRAYLKASMDFCVLAPQLRLALDSLLIQVCYDEWNQVRNQQHISSATLGKHSRDFDRISNWSRDLAEGEKTLRRQLLLARKTIEDEAEVSARPSRELESYAISTVPYLNSGARPGGPNGDAAPAFKQGWLFLRTITGKPVRHQWVRRWFFVKNGIFGCLIQGARSGGVEESEKIGVLLCGVRAAFQEERRFCFEIKTTDTSILLQAETQGELVEWMSAFEKAKQKAIEEPGTTDLLASSGNPSADAAFAVSPAVAPEFAARGADGQITSITEDAQTSMLAPEDAGPTVDARHSIDVTQGRKGASDRDGDSGRDHAARILQKLDIHRKTTAGSQVSGSAMGAPINPGGGGIGSLIAASQGALAMAPGGRHPSTTGPGPATDKPAAPIFTSSLAPSTLVNLPVQTNLSKTALKLGVDRGMDLGVVDNSGGVPSGLMANQWGSANYGHISRHERGEVEKKPMAVSPAPSRRNSDPTDAADAITDLPTIAKVGTTMSTTPDGPKHRKTVSAESRSISTSAPALNSDFPSFYPMQLRAHDSQFRMLFPNVPPSDRVVMVFRASWNPENSPNIPGRVFVTPSELFFYGNHLGMIVVRSAAFSDISEVSVEHGTGGGDAMHLHLKESGGQEETMQLKVFLEYPRLLQRRLNYLISNYDSEEPDELAQNLQTLVRLETTDLEQDQDDNEFDDLFTGRGRRHSQRAQQIPRAGVRLDKSFALAADGAKEADGDIARFRLPPQPVNYKPIGMNSLVFERVFDVSAKALLHIIYGDKSAVCPIMNQQRGARNIIQQPWTKLDDEGHYRRQFEFQVDMVNRLGITTHAVPVVDSQKIDVASDHLCYVVSETKVPWHLPRPKDFVLVFKMVITHEAKSKCKLAIYTRVDWLNEPWISKSMIERFALDDMELDALNMADLVTEQVSRLGAGCPTRKIIDIYGYIGAATEVAQEISTDVSPYGRPLRVAVRVRSIWGLLFETLRSVGESALTTIVMSLIGVLRYLLKSLGAHGFLLGLLSISLATTIWSTSDWAANWWRDRRAASFMNDVGVGPNPMLSKAIYLRDIQDEFLARASVVTSQGPHDTNSTSANAGSQCNKTFQKILSQSSIDGASPQSLPSLSSTSSIRATACRLSRTRARLATYRHDLIVAMRLVNGIEREAVQAEYENWLVEETTTCTQIRGLLHAKGRTSSTSVNATDSEDDVMTKMGEGDAARLREWHDGYCQSCEAEKVARLGSGGLDVRL